MDQQNIEQEMDPQSVEDHNLVERYVTGRLSPVEASRFEEYFLKHPECALQVEAAQRLQRGLQAVAAQEAVRTSLVLGFWSRLLRSRFAMVVPLLLLAVVAIPLALQMQRIDRLENTLEAANQPQVNTPIFELTPFRSSGISTSPANLLTLSSELEWIVLALAVSPDHPMYRVELLAADDRLVWQASDLRPDPLDRLVMTLPSTLLSPGDYEIRIAGAAVGADSGGTDSDGTDSDGVDSGPMARYALRVDVGF